MKRNLFKLPLMALLFFAIIFLQNCANQEAIQPQPNTEQVTLAPNVLQKIKTLGFTDDQIKEMPDYYLADGDLYFSKKESEKNTLPANKPKQRILEKYFTLTIRIDESLSDDIDSRWREGLDQAIAEWNSDQDIHFHFALTSAADANISIVKDNNLPKDVSVASEFPSNGRTGSSIRINFAAANVLENPKQTLLHAIKHCVGHLHSNSPVNRKATLSDQASKNARGPRYAQEIYTIQGDWLYRIDVSTWTSQYYPVSKGWAGTEAMGQVNGFLYVVQFGRLIGVNPASGFRYPLTTGWEGTQYIARTLEGNSAIDGSLYIMQNGYIYPVNPDDGSNGDAVGGKQWTNVHGLIGLYYKYFSGPKLVVLQKQTLVAFPVGGGSAYRYDYSRVSVIEPSSGKVVEAVNVRDEEISDWNGYRGIASYRPLIVYNGNVNWVGDGQGVNYTWSYTTPGAIFYHNLEQVTGSSRLGKVFSIDDGKLMVQADAARGWVTTMSEPEWYGTVGFVLLDKVDNIGF